MLYGQRIAETGVGKTVNISSGGVWFTTENTLTPGMPVELSMNWPVLLHDSCPMKLMIYGCVIRSSEKGAAVSIERYEFRTQGSRTFQQPHPPIVHRAPAPQLARPDDRPYSAFAKAAYPQYRGALPALSLARERTPCFGRFS